MAVKVSDARGEKMPKRNFLSILSGGPSYDDSDWGARQPLWAHASPVVSPRSRSRNRKHKHISISGRVAFVNSSRANPV